MTHQPPKTNGVTDLARALCVVGMFSIMAAVSVGYVTLAVLSFAGVGPLAGVSEGIFLAIGLLAFLLADFIVVKLGMSML